ncbi:MAG: hypothetical protein AAF728_14990 [Cyanobacteria bacterium P01_D01_bin.128]
MSDNSLEYLTDADGNPKAGLFSLTFGDSYCPETTLRFLDQEDLDFI